MFEKSATFAAAILSDTIREMLRVQSSLLTPEYVSSMKTLAVKSLDGFVKTFLEELGDRATSYLSDEIILESDDNDVVLFKQENMAIKCLTESMRSVGSLLQKAGMRGYGNYHPERGMVYEELATVEFVSAFESLFMTISDILRDLHHNPSIRSELTRTIVDLNMRLERGDHLCVIPASRLLSLLDEEPGGRIKALAQGLDISENDASRISDRVKHLCSRVSTLEGVSLSECMYLSQLVLTGFRYVKFPS